MGVGEEQILEYFRFTKVNSEVPLDFRRPRAGHSLFPPQLVTSP